MSFFLFSSANIAFRENSNKYVSILTICKYREIWNYAIENIFIFIPPRKKSSYSTHDIISTHIGNIFPCTYVD